MKRSKKIVLLGQFGVGKTSLMRRLLENIFEHDYKPTLGVQIKKKELQMPNGKTLSMIVWDLEGFTSVVKARASYLLGSEGFVYVFDLSRPITYECLEAELNFIKEKYPKVTTLLVGNKADIEDPSKVAEVLAKKNIIPHSFVSAKTGDGVQEVFIDLAKKMIR